MATIQSEFNYIQEAKENLALALVSKFGVRELDDAKDNPTLEGLWKMDDNGNKGPLKRLHDWAVLVNGTNVHTDGKLIFSTDGDGATANANGNFNGLLDVKISYNSIGAAKNNLSFYLGNTAIPINRTAGELTLDSVNITGNVTGNVTGNLTGNIIPILLTNESLNSDILDQVNKFYYAVGGNTVTNKPDNVTAFGLLNMKTAGSHIGQLLIATDQGKGLYYRGGNTTSFSPVWNKVLDSSTDYKVVDQAETQETTWRSITLATSTISSMDDYARSWNTTGKLGITTGVAIQPSTGNLWLKGNITAYGLGKFWGNTHNIHALPDPSDATFNPNANITVPWYGMMLYPSKNTSNENTTHYQFYSSGFFGWQAFTANGILAMTSAGKVGIGLQSPVEKLDVLGNLRLGNSESDASLELWRVNSASWKFLVTGGELKIQNNWSWTPEAHKTDDYFDVITVSCGHGRAVFKNTVASLGFIHNGIPEGVTKSNCVLTAAGGYKELGNVANNLAVNNGVLCANLNADLLDGKHAADLFTSFDNSNDNTITTTIGGTTKSLIVDYSNFAKRLTRESITISSGGTNNDYTKFASIDVSAGDWIDSDMILFVHDQENAHISGILRFHLRSTDDVTKQSVDIKWLVLTNNNYANSIQVVKTGNRQYDLYWNNKDTYSNISFSVIKMSNSEDKTMKVTFISENRVTLLPSTPITESSLLGWTSNAINANKSISAEKIESSLISGFTTSYKLGYLQWFRLNSTNAGSAGNAGDASGFPVNNNANGVLWLGSHTGNYGGQLGVSSNGNLYYRFMSGGTYLGGSSWKEIAWRSDIPEHVANSIYWTNATSKDAGGVLTLNHNGIVTTGIDKVRQSFYADAAGNANTVGNWSATGLTGQALKKSGVVSSNKSGTSCWIKVASFTWVYQSSDRDVTLYMHSAFNQISGIVHIRARLNANNNSSQFVKIIGNIPKEKLRLYYNNANVDGSIELWADVGERYGAFNTILLSETGRVSVELSFVTLYNSVNVTEEDTEGRPSNYIEAEYTTLLNNASPIFPGNVSAAGTVTASGFIKNSSSNNYVLLGGGGHKPVTDFFLGLRSNSSTAYDNNQRLMIYSGVVPYKETPTTDRTFESGIPTTLSAVINGETVPVQYAAIIRINQGENYYHDISADYNKWDLYHKGVRTVSTNVTSGWRKIYDSGNLTDFDSTKGGLVPKPTSSDTGKFLKSDGTWGVPTNTWHQVTSSSPGYVPPTGPNVTAAIGERNTNWILTSESGSNFTWKLLPENAFKNDDVDTLSITVIPELNPSVDIPLLSGNSYTLNVGSKQYRFKMPGSESGSTSESSVTITMPNTSIGDGIRPIWWNGLSFLTTSYNLNLVGGINSIGLVKNGSSVNNTDGYTACPIVNGTPYYQNTTYGEASNIAGLIRLGYTTSATNRNYALATDANRGYVNIPAASDTGYGVVKVAGVDTDPITTLNDADGQYIGVRRDGNGKLYVGIPAIPTMPTDYIKSTILTFDWDSEEEKNYFELSLKSIDALGINRSDTALFEAGQNIAFNKNSDGSLNISTYNLVNTTSDLTISGNKTFNGDSVFSGMLVNNIATFSENAFFRKDIYINKGYAIKEFLGNGFETSLIQFVDGCIYIGDGIRKTKLLGVTSISFPRESGLNVSIQRPNTLETKLDIKERIGINGSANIAYDIALNGSVIVTENLKVEGRLEYYTMVFTSDIRRKTNIKEIQKSNIDLIKFKEFDWKDSGKHSYGVIAQEIEPYIPEVVSTDSEGYKSVDYIALLILKVQQLQDQIDELKSKLKA